MNNFGPAAGCFAIGAMALFAHPVIGITIMLAGACLASRGSN